MRTTHSMYAAPRRSVAALVIVASLLALLLSARPATAQELPVCTPGSTLAIQLVIDDSGSMFSNDPSNLRAAAASLVINQLPNADIVGAIRFANSPAVLFAPTALDNLNRQGLEQSVLDDLRSSGGTEYGPALVLAGEQLALAAADRSAVIFLSDGQPFDPDQSEHLSIGAPVFTVGLGGDTTDVLEPIATATGARHFEARDAADIQNAFAAIVSAIRCEAQVGVFDDFLRPGEVAEHLIDVPSTAAELRATATWARGDFLVELIEPAGTPRYGPVGPYPAGIVYTKADTFVTFGATDPTPGGWRIRIEALPATPLEGVRVTSQITFRDGRTTPPPPVGPPPVAPTPLPSPPVFTPPPPPPPTSAVVFVGGLRSSQPFADPGTLAGCAIGGTWKSTAAETQRELAGRYQVFLAPAERSRPTPDCPGVRARTTDIMHINTTRHADQDVNGVALVVFLGHLRRNYGITDVWLVGHSYGGIWSRSALTRLANGTRPAVRINGIISVGTPHSGSFGADFVDDLGSSCFLPTNQARAIACAAATGARAHFGPALDGLTAASLGAWNRNQTNQARWGCVPVATIAGTGGVGIDLNRFGVQADYITPNDVIVGRRSALGVDAGISWRLPQPTFNVIHIPLPGPLSGLRVMTTDIQVRENIVRLLRDPPPARARCGGTLMTQARPFEGGLSHTVRVTAQRPARSRPVRVAFVASSGGRHGSGSIARPGRGESLVLVEGAVAFCAGKRVPSIPLLGLQDLQVTGDRPCPSGSLRIRATKAGAGAAGIGRTRAGVTVTTPGRGRLGLSLYGLSKGSRASVRVTTLSGRRVANARIVAGRRTQVRVRPGRYRVTVMRLGVRQALQTTVRV